MNIVVSQGFVAVHKKQRPIDSIQLASRSTLVTIRTNCLTITVPAGVGQPWPRCEGMLVGGLLTPKSGNSFSTLTSTRPNP